MITVHIDEQLKILDTMIAKAEASLKKGPEESSMWSGATARTNTIIKKSRRRHTENTYQKRILPSRLLWFKEIMTVNSSPQQARNERDCFR